jgi:hypothetical protein
MIKEIDIYRMVGEEVWCAVFGKPQKVKILDYWWDKTNDPIKVAISVPHPEKAKNPMVRPSIHVVELDNLYLTQLAALEDAIKDAQHDLKSARNLVLHYEKALADYQQDRDALLAPVFPAAPETPKPVEADDVGNDEGR